MERLELDYLRAGWRRLAAVYLLAAVAIACAAYVSLSYRTLRNDIAIKEARLAKRGAMAIQEPAAAAAPPLSTEEYAFARDTVRRLSTPWTTLFQALEAAQTDRVTLLAIEPDVENRTLGVSGEAKDYLATLTYVANLADQKTLARVHLARHEVRRGPQQRPIAFTVSAAWKEER